MLASRVKMLEVALHEVRQRHGEDTTPPSPLAAHTPPPVAAERTAFGGRTRQQLLEQVLRDNGMEPIDEAALEVLVLKERQARKRPQQQQHHLHSAPSPAAALAAVAAEALPRGSIDEVASLQALVTRVDLSGAEALLQLPASAGAEEGQSAPPATTVPPLPVAEEAPAAATAAEDENDVDAFGANKADMGRMLKRLAKGGKSPRKSPRNVLQLDPPAGAAADNGAGDEDLARWAASRTLRGHLDSVRGVAFHSTRPLLCSVSDDWTVRVFSASVGPPLSARARSRVQAGADCLWAYRCLAPTLCVVTLGDAVYAGALDGSLHRWLLPDDELMATGLSSAAFADGHVAREAHQDALWGLCSLGDDTIVSAGVDGLVRLWDAALPEEPRATVSSERCCCAASGLSGATVAVAYRDGQRHAELFDMSTCQSVRTFFEPSLGLSTSLSAGAHHLVVTSHMDHKVCLWDARSDEPVAHFVAHTAPVSCVSIDASGALLVTGCCQGNVRVWDLPKRSCLTDMVAHRQKFDESVACIRFHPSQPLFASGGCDAIIKLYNK